MLHAPKRVAPVITRSTLKRLLASDFFLWATGIEDTFITDPHRATGRTLDEYALTQHYECWEQDLELIASLGVRYARYGIPWYRIEPTPGHFDFAWIDQVFDKMLKLGVHPIVDLMHYGTPAWLQGGFGNTDYPQRVADYAAQIAERYRGLIFWYTPLNEPRITAYYCGRLGWWPPYGRSWREFTRVMTSICRGIVLTQNALRSIDPEIVCAHVDATDLYEAGAPGLERESEWRQQLVFLALDLMSGRVIESHPLHAWLLRSGAETRDLQWFQEQAIELDVIGLNVYPMFSKKQVFPGRVRMRYGDGSIVERLGRLYWERYGRPMFISETAAVGSRRRKWLSDSLEAVKALRDCSIPMCGYTWWPLFALVAWAYREKDLPFERYLLQLGLWNLGLDGGGRLVRIPTPLVPAYASAVANGTESVGKLRQLE